MGLSARSCQINAAGRGHGARSIKRETHAGAGAPGAALARAARGEVPPQPQVLFHQEPPVSEEETHPALQVRGLLFSLLPASCLRLKAR